VIKPEDGLLFTWEPDAKRLARLRHVATAGKIMMLVMTMVVGLGVLRKHGLDLMRHNSCRSLL
jgi:hypothetical protein